MTLDEELGEQYRKKGLQAALDDYAELKKKYYGRAAFDFGEGSLNVFAYSLLENNDIPGAIQVLKLNADMFSDSANVWDSLAEGYMKGCRGRILERLYIDNCLPLTVELFHQLAFFILSCKPISYCRFKRIDVYIL